MRRTLFDEDHELFRSIFREFVEKEIVPNHEAWERAGIVDGDLFRTAGRIGFLGSDVPLELRGGGVKHFRYNLVTTEDTILISSCGVGLRMTLHNFLCIPYYLHL